MPRPRPIAILPLIPAALPDSGSENHTSLSPPVRQKQWATKAKTGCLTCRKRRVKCDEQKPICKRCQTGKRYCAGKGYQDKDSAQNTPESSPESTARTSPSASDSVTFSPIRSPASSTFSTRSDSVPMELIPIEWAAVEACEFMNSLWFPIRTEKFLWTNGLPAPRKPQVGHSNSHALVAGSLAAKLALISSQQGIELQPSEAFQTKHLWDKLYYWTNQTIQSVNHDLSNLPGNFHAAVASNAILERICHLATTEAVTGLLNWRAHLEGFIALLKVYGGARKVPKSQRRIWKAIQRVVVHSILANTVGPPDMHITSIYAMGDDDLWFIYSDEHMGGFPCATVLFKQLVAITRLRGSSEDIRLRAEEIFAQIEQFNPESWTEPYDIPEIVEVTLMAKTFKLSVALYGALTLPVENLSIGLKRESLKDELIELIRTGTAYTKCHASLLWPLIVVGTALVDESSKPDQEYVSTLLRDLDFGIGNVSSSGRAYQRITDFWASRKTKWDECWIEPYVCVLL